MVFLELHPCVPCLSVLDSAPPCRALRFNSPASDELLAFFLGDPTLFIPPCACGPWAGPEDKDAYWEEVGLVTGNLSKSDHPIQLQGSYSGSWGRGAARNLSRGRSCLLGSHHCPSVTGGKTSPPGFP